MTKRKVVRKSKAGKKKPVAPKTKVQQALEITWVLKGHLKNAQISYLRVGAMLRRIRDEALYAELKHPDMESYAEERLHLGRASLYRYLQVYDWVAKNHKEWLEPKPQGFIPDLADAAGLIWIEQKLGQKNLNKETKSTLEGLRQKALDGKLKSKDLNKVRKQGKAKDDGLKAFLSKLRRLRKQGVALASLPPEAITQFDDLIETVKHTITAQVAGLHLIRAENQLVTAPNFYAAKRCSVV